MEAKELHDCTRPAAGELFFRDDYGVLYGVVWSVDSLGQLDVTTTIRQPVVPGHEPLPGVMRLGVLWRTGLITIHRQVFAQHPSGYQISSEGQREYVGEYQDSFPCGRQPFDPFCYHLDSMIQDDPDLEVVAGPRWTDPTGPAGTEALAAGVTGAATITWGHGFAWVDVWNN